MVPMLSNSLPMLLPLVADGEDLRNHDGILMCLACIVCLLRACIGLALHLLFQF